MAVDTTQTSTTEIPDLAPVEITLEVPGRVAHDYGLLVRTGVHLSLEEALRATLVTGWRYDRGTYHSVRLDWGTADEKVPDDESAPDNGAERGAPDTPDAPDAAAPA